MLFSWQKAQNPFIDSKLEGWYQMNVWGRLIDPVFDNQNFDLVRGESMSFASSDRKNHKRATINNRKKIGRKGDEVFRLSGDRLEFGAIEAGRKWEGKSGTKYLNDSLKINKMLKDMIGQLAVACDGKEDLMRKLQVVGILHGANRIQLLIMDYTFPVLNIERFTQLLDMSGPLAYTLKEILCAKAIINQTLDIINTKNNVNLENFLDDSDENGYRTPPRTATTPKTFITPKTKRTLDVINNDSE